jgi:transcriptional regulator with XRE-family HTH domain
MDTFAEWLANEMNRRQWSQAELARRAGTSRSAINGLITGVRGPGPDLSNAIAHAFNLPAEDVYRAAGLLPPEPTLDEQAAAIAYRASKMTQAEKRAVLAFMNSLEQGEIEPVAVPPIGGKLDPVSK